MVLLELARSVAKFVGIAGERCIYQDDIDAITIELEGLEIYHVLVRNCGHKAGLHISSENGISTQGSLFGHLISSI